MGRLVLLKGFLEPKLSEVQHISIENISTVVFRREAFTQIIVNVMINQVNNIVMEERSFSSCWGSVWIVNHGTHKNINGNAMSSSDMMLWQDDQFKSHPRPESTPFQKVIIHLIIIYLIKINIIHFIVPRSDRAGR